MRSYFRFWIIILAICFSKQAFCGQNADDLYRQGRFAEAEKAYSKLDMDHPEDIRFRYNRGCAAYQKGDYKGAMGAFSSVIKKTEDNDIRFRASFNMGNAAYSSGEFKSAVDWFKRAIRYNPENGDARYNLELALIMLKKTKEKQDGSKHEDKPSQDRKAEKAKQPSEEKGPDMLDQQERHPNSTVGKKEEKNTRKNEVSQSHKDLSGELQTFQPITVENVRNKTTDVNEYAVNRKNAEALLENIREDRSRFLQFQIPEEKKHGAKPAKAW